MGFAFGAVAGDERVKFRRRAEKAAARIGLQVREQGGEELCAEIPGTLP